MLLHTANKLDKYFYQYLVGRGLAPAVVDVRVLPAAGASPRPTCVYILPISDYVAFFVRIRLLSSYSHPRLLLPTPYSLLPNITVR